MAEKRKTAGRKREVVEMMFTGADRALLVTDRMKRLYEDGRAGNPEGQKKDASPEGQAAEMFQEELGRTPQESIRMVRTVKRASERVRRVKEARDGCRERINHVKMSSGETARTVPATSVGERMKAAAMKRAGETAKQTTHAGGKAAKQGSTMIARAKKMAVNTVKAISQGIKSSAALIGALGGTTVMVILVICMAAMIFGSAFGIFFTGTGENGERTIRTVMYELDSEYEQTLIGIQNSQEHDILEMHGKRPEWKDVLAIYAVKTNLDPNDPEELITMTAQKERKLRDIYWDMCSISSKVGTEWRIVTITVVGKDGKEMEKKVLREVTVLTIRTDSATAEQMAGKYFFDWEQRELLRELLDSGKDLFWEGIIP